MQYTARLTTAFFTASSYVKTFTLITCNWPHVLRNDSGVRHRVLWINQILRRRLVKVLSQMRPTILTGSPCSDTRNQPHRATESEAGSKKRPFRPDVGQAASCFTVRAVKSC